MRVAPTLLMGILMTAPLGAQQFKAADQNNFPRRSQLGLRFMF